MISFFSFWVEGIFGTALLSLFGTAALLILIGIFGKWSYMLLFTMIGLYFLVFGVGFYGTLIFLIFFLLGLTYFFIQFYKFVQS